ncbi:transcriptional regulator [Rhizobium acaciae]|uniref:HVO_A0114 family putative DNA-binding protein n=1 Tax=Rhizobium acaciae TaxID=2989736 RepID=UPI003F9CBEC0
MRTLVIRLSSIADAKARFVSAGQKALEGVVVPATPSVNFLSYDDMHRVLAPSRLAIVKAMAGEGPLAIREVARRVGRDVQAVHKDVTTLVNAGVLNRTEAGVEFPYDQLHFEFDVKAAA